MLAFLLALPMVAQTNFRAISYSEAIQQAKNENKMVFIDFYTDWCGPCRKMSRDVFPQKSVGDYLNGQFVCIKLNAEKEGLEQAKRFNVKAYPTFIVLDTNETVKMHIEGALSAEAFVTKVKNELNPDMTPERMKQRYEGGERTPELINAYALSLMEQKKEQEGLKVINDYFNSLSDEQRLSADNFFLFSRYTFSLNDPKGEFLVNNFGRAEASIRKDAATLVDRLFRREIITYLSGHKFATKEYNEADYLKLKNQIVKLGLDKSYPYQPLFSLIECYAKGDMEAYFTMVKSEKEAMNEEDFELVLLNTSRLYPQNSPILPEVAKYIRSLLPELRGSSIMMMGRLLMNIEKTDQ